MKSCLKKNKINLRKFFPSGFLLAFLIYLNSISLSWANSSASLELEGRNTTRKSSLSPISQNWQNDLSLYEVGLSFRHVLADTKGDRLILFADFEGKDNFKNNEVHEIYTRIKGPMGLWNLTLGRFAVPFGQNCHTSTFGRLLDFPSSDFRGFHADNGLMLSGALPLLDYNLSFTQGLGSHTEFEWPGPGLVSGRISRNWGETEEFSTGFSSSLGNFSNSKSTESTPIHQHGKVILDSNSDNNPATAQFLGAVGLDFTLLVNSHQFTAEWVQAIQTKKGTSQLSGLFLQWDNKWNSRWESQTALKMSKFSPLSLEGFSGLMYLAPWFQLKGSLKYEYIHYAKNNPQPVYGAVLQIMRSFNATW